MPALRVDPLPTVTAEALRAGRPDAYGRPPERHRATGPDTPCRHCLRPVPDGAEALLLAHRPFAAAQPYAETGPIFLCAQPCPAWDGPGLPPNLTASPSYLLRGYGADERIVGGTGGVVPASEILARAAAILAGPATAVHVRSATNNCFHCRILPG